MPTLPFVPGTGLSEPQTADFMRLIRRLLPDGFTQEDDSIFAGELTAYARLLLANHQANRRLKANTSPRTTTELLADFEAVFRLPDDASREISERQERLVAATAARGGASPSRIATALAGISDSADPQTPTAAEIDYDDLADEGQLVFQLLTTLTEEEYADERIRKTVATILARIVPARCFGQDGVPSIASSIGTSEATWLGTGVLGRTYIRRPESAGVEASSPAQRLRQYGPGSIIRAADLNAIQDACLREGANGAQGDVTTIDWSTTSRGQHGYAFAIRVNNGATSLLGPSNTSIDWRNRFVVVALRHATTDIRPGQGGAATFSDEGSYFTRLLFMGPGDTLVSSTSYRAPIASNLEIFADSTDGELYIHNATGAARSLVGFVYAGPPYDEVVSSPSFPDLTDGDATLEEAGIGQDWLGELASRAHLQWFEGATVADDWKDGEGEGSHSIVAYVVNLRPGETVAIDTVRDWRDRVIHVTPLVVDQEAWGGTIDYDAGPLGADATDDDPADISTPDTITGNGDGDATAQNSAIGYPVTGQISPTFTGTSIRISSSLRLYVRFNASGGNPAGSLMLTRDTAMDRSSGKTFLLMIEGSYRTGKNSTPTVWPEIVAVDEDPIEPGLLNGLQDRAMIGVASESVPLGRRHVRGNARPYIPEALRHHDRVLAQQIGAVGWVRRVFATAIDAETELVLDDTIDWTDRIVRAWALCSSTLDLLPGEADDDTHANDISRVVARYTGSGGHGSVDAPNAGYQLILEEDIYVYGTPVALASNLGVGQTLILPIGGPFPDVTWPNAEYDVIVDNGVDTEILHVTSVDGSGLHLAVGPVNAYNAGPSTVALATLTGDTGLCIYARPGTGYLVLRNQTAVTQRVNAWIDASFQLGLRR